MSLLTKDYDYHLPQELIASRPLADRAASRMLVIHRETGRIEHRMFADFESYLKPEDLLVLNNTRVIPARLFSDDGRTELLCLDQLSPTQWRCLAKPGKRMKVGKSVIVGGITGIVVEVFENGDRLMLVSALAGRELTLEAYRQAVAEKYRFYSYGDCMLIL